MRGGRASRRWTLLIAAFCALPAAAQVAGQWRDSAHIWRAVCGHCHGAGVARPLFGTPLPPQAIIAITRNGLNGMPAFVTAQLSDHELERLAQWLREQPAGAQERD
ncbi:MAG: cytochrome c [Spongiibacteraceae bacterium]|jgi:mono/diheme cytochrome c family protein|nr:cytochrome c [Spongiibacteraceae bacterium]